MALKRNANGQFIIKTQAEAVRAIAMMQNLQDEIAELEKNYGIDEMKMDATELKRAATAFCADNEITQLDVPKAGKVAKLIRAVNKKMWIGTKEDMDNLDAPNGAKPLRSLVSKELWMEITTRIPDPAKIDQAVADGKVKADKIAPAYVETYKAPYLGIYDA